MRRENGRRLLAAGLVLAVLAMSLAGCVLARAHGHACAETCPLCASLLRMAQWLRRAAAAAAVLIACAGASRRAAMPRSGPALPLALTPVLCGVRMDD